MLFCLPYDPDRSVLLTFAGQSFHMCSLGVLVRYSRQSARQVLQISKRSFSKMSEALNNVEEVDIDPSGVFKYILIEVKENGKNGTMKNIVRGYARCDYHADIFDVVEAALKKISPSLKAKCVGGGRIQHDADVKKLKVYGYSQGYGKADHELSVSILKKKYPDYEITCSDEGY